MDTSQSSAVPPRAPAAKDSSKYSSSGGLSPPASGQIKPLRASDLPKAINDPLENGAASFKHGAMEAWLQQNATTFSPAGYRSQLQPKLKLPITVPSGDSSSQVRAACV